MGLLSMGTRSAPKSELETRAGGQAPKEWRGTAVHLDSERHRLQKRRAAWAHLQHAAHPLEAVLLGGVRPLLGHKHDPVIVQHCHREHGNPGGRRGQK